MDLVPEARFVIAVIGALTAFAAGLAAIGQWDVKRVLAYSTVSQLGFMIAAVGIGAYVAAMFHLVTHAVFKALLFLGSGSLIHGVEHGEHHVHEHHGHGHDDHHDDHAFDPQDMRNMGGLAGKMPITFVTYLVGTFGLMGLPFFAGFWSKDEILLEAFLKSFTEPELSTLEITGALIVFGLLTVAAFFTTFYMWRQIQMVFFGKTRSEAAEHAPESVAWMTVPLAILAVGVLWVGFINLPKGTFFFDWMISWGWFGNAPSGHGLGHFLEKTIPSISQHKAPDFNWFIALTTSVALPAAAIFLAHVIYAGDRAVVDRDEEHGELGVDPLYKEPATRQLWVAANRRLYSDDLYHAIFLYPYERIGKFFAETLDWNFWHDYLHNNVIKAGFDAFAEILSKPIDVGVIDAVVNGVGKVVSFFSGRSRGIQTGYVRTYAAAVFIGVVLVIVLMLLPLLLNGS
ncbi:MAG: proton-conducting transporter membrane subunit [Chloroflexota bacterium]